jgi:hypothetical protein
MSPERETQMAYSRADTLVRVRDLGARLERVVAKYDRLVRGLSGEEAAPLDLDSRLHLANRELGWVVRQVQEVLVVEYEARRQPKSGSVRQAGRRPHEHRQAEAPPRRPARPSVVTPFVSAAYRHRTLMASDSTRIAAAR